MIKKLILLVSSFFLLAGSVSPAFAIDYTKGYPSLFQGDSLYVFCTGERLALSKLGRTLYSAFCKYPSNPDASAPSYEPLLVLNPGVGSFIECQGTSFAVKRFDGVTVRFVCK